ncbi:hypothetical protein [Nioella ostreopsis]|uniref:hypothetical protein n=1 Tax=Nioella ostreopsis TaxID=2448479 RepID=UPI000FD79CEC|nr:hypothetical protein [Nioella ostreopsis]
MIGLLVLPSVIGLVTCFLGERLGAARPRGLRIAVAVALSALFFVIYAVVRTPSVNLMRDGGVIMVLVGFIGLAGGSLGAAVAALGPRWLSYGVSALVPTIFWF